MCDVDIYKKNLKLLLLSSSDSQFELRIRLPNMLEDFLNIFAFSYNKVIVNKHAKVFGSPHVSP